MTLKLVPLAGLTPSASTGKGSHVYLLGCLTDEDGDVSIRSEVHSTAACNMRIDAFLLVRSHRIRI